ncbi:hypothetical protein [Mucilaginibacter sp.]|uniref:hypothetical protein n=1 Tax=Mucilaginibacter sp. TaxID=1882438 RepID=UPI003267A9D0
MKKVFIYSLKVGLTTLIASVVFSLAALYMCMGLVMLVNASNWSFYANIDFLDLAALTGISSLVLLFVAYRVNRSAPGVYNRKSQITVSTFFFSVPFFYLYFSMIKNSGNYSLGSILLMVLPTLFALMLSIRFYRLEPEIPIQHIDANEV